MFSATSNSQDGAAIKQSLAQPEGGGNAIRPRPAVQKRTPWPLRLLQAVRANLAVSLRFLRGSRIRIASRFVAAIDATIEGNLAIRVRDRDGGLGQAPRAVTLIVCRIKAAGIASVVDNFSRGSACTI